MNVIKHWQRDQWYSELVKMGEQVHLSDDTAPRLVVLVRDDILPPIAIGIQAAHAVICLSNSVHLDARSYLILLGASQEEIGKLKRKVKVASAMYVDVGLVDPATGLPVLTACAFTPMNKEDVKRNFGHLKRAS